MAGPRPHSRGQRRDTFEKRKVFINFFAQYFYSQNLSFGLAPQIKKDVSPFSYQFANKASVSYRIDWVQQYGKKAFGNFHLGQSELRYHDSFFTVGFGTQNFKLGPAIINPIILSRNAGVFLV